MSSTDETSVFANPQSSVPPAAATMNPASPPSAPPSISPKEELSAHIPSDNAEEEQYDSEYEKAIVRKLDWHIVPLVMLLYLFSFLDRVNIGSARLYGLEADLGLVGTQYQLLVSILFVTYLTFEIPGNLVLKKFTPRRYISFITVAWGIVATCSGTVQTFGGMLACRLILGAVEASLFPGLTIYLTMFYTKSELALRIGYLFVSAALAGACGGLLAYGIGFMDGVAGQSGWRWILILEGIPTVFLGIFTFFYLADNPDTAFYLTPDEQIYCVKRLSRDPTTGASAREFHWADVRACFLDWKCWAFAVAQFGEDTMLYGYSTFLPTIIKSIGTWSNAEVQALTIPCYAIGAITYLLVARLSDAHGQRGLYTIIFSAISMIGYGLLLSDTSAGVHYTGCFLVAMGLYVAVGLPLAWLPNNSPRYGKRTTGTGLQLTFGNAAGVMVPFVYLSPDAPRFIRGHAVSLAMVGMAAVVYAVLWWTYASANKKRREGKEEYKTVGLTEEQVKELGDESPRFVYTI